MVDVKKIRTSELRYRRLFEAAQDGILILDAKTGAIAELLCEHVKQFHL